MAAATRHPRSGLGRRWVRLGQAVGLGGVFLAASAAGVVVHLDLPAGRRFAARALTELLSSTFRGKITIDHFNHIGLRSIAAADIRVSDPYGNEVLRVSKLKARANLARIARDIAFGSGDLTIWIEHVRIERAEGYIIPDADTGVPTLAGAFTPVPSGEPDSGASRTRRVRVWLPAIEVGRAWRGPSRPSGMLKCS